MGTQGSREPPEGKFLLREKIHCSHNEEPYSAKQLKGLTEGTDKIKHKFRTAVLEAEHRINWSAKRLL
jgi:hypothetical protein